MVKVATQTPIISLFLLILSLETSFIPSIALNLSVVAFCILFMLYYRRFKMFGLDDSTSHFAILGQLLGSSVTWRCFAGSHAWNEGFCDRLYWSCLCFLYFPKRASLVLGSKGVITLLVLCLDCGIQFLPPHSARNQISQGSLPITRSRTTFFGRP